MSENQDKFDRSPKGSVLVLPEIDKNSDFNELERYVRGCAQLNVFPDRQYLPFGLRLLYAYWRAFHLWPQSRDADGTVQLLTGRSEKQFARYVQGAEPPFSVVHKLSIASGVPIEWIAGEDMMLDQDFKWPKRIGEGASHLPPKSHDFFEQLDIEAARRLTANSAIDHVGPITDSSMVDKSDLVRIPVYDMRYSAGEGSSMALEELPPADDMAFSRRWLRGIGVNPEHAILDWAVGDSMWPTIPDGAAIIIDTSVREVRHGFIYAINLGGFLMVKRIARRTDGTVELISDNRDKYPVEIVPESRLAELHVVGRVYYVGHAL
jgi:phage repressor protein C with HTH and peptisase S24 domain